MINETVGYYNGEFKISNHIVKSFDIVPNSFEDMIQMNETNIIKVHLFDIQSDTMHNDAHILEMTNFIKNEAFLIVFGGWIPCTFIKQNTILLADRNIVSEIIRRYKDGIKKVKEEFDSLDYIFLNHNLNVMLDITAYVIEGNERKIPTNSMIDQQIAIVKRDIKSALPNLKIATYPNGNAYYHDLKNLLKPIIENRILFLQEIVPSLNKQFTEKTRENAVDMVFEIATKIELKKNDIVVLLALLRILMKGNKTAAQLVLKDSQRYSEESAYNAAFDLTTIEILINLYYYHEKNTNHNIALITQDKGLSLFSSLFNKTKISSRSEGKIQVAANILFSVFNDDEALAKKYEEWLKGEV